MTEQTLAVSIACVAFSLSRRYGASPAVRLTTVLFGS